MCTPKDIDQEKQDRDQDTENESDYEDPSEELDKEEENICIRAKWSIDDASTIDEAVEKLKSNKRPRKAEFTNIEIIDEDWAKGAQHEGQELIAKMAQKIAGTKKAEIAVCAKGGTRTGSPRSFPKGSFDSCRICLRENVRK